MSEENVIRFLNTWTSLTGKELRDKCRLEELALWRICNNSKKIETNIIGQRYLRLDKRVDKYARLSPSIKREFLTYTVCGLKDNRGPIQEKSDSLENQILEISQDKLTLAEDIFQRVIDSSEHKTLIEENVCFIIAGDIVYNMAHLEPRPERSTGKLVRGSDLDIIIITEDDFPEVVREELDKNIYMEKYLCLIKPDLREEIDYIIKDISKTRSQLEFDSFKSMVASKILWEGKYLNGSREIFDTIKKMLFDFKIAEKISKLEKKAAENRKEAESILLKGTGQITEEESLKLFYTTEESDEIF
jgi:hypothetical protein